MQGVMAALHEEGTGQGPPKRPHVPGLIDAGLVPLQTLMHQCWHQVTTWFAHFQCTTTSSAQVMSLFLCSSTVWTVYDQDSIQGPASLFLADSLIANLTVHLLNKPEFEMS